MTYDAQEDSLESGVPVTLFRFSYAGLRWNYADGDIDITRDGVTYSSTVIGRSSIEQGRAGFDRLELEIDCAPTLGIANFYRSTPPAGEVGVQLFQGHADLDPADFIAVWVGTVAAFQDRRPFARLVCEPVYTALKRNGLRRTYQVQCPWALYGDGCRASKAAVKRSVAVTAVGENFLEFGTNWEGALSVNKYRGGFLEFTNSVINGKDRRSILRIGGPFNERIIVSGEIYGVEVGDIVDIFPGCNKRMDDCRDIHSNLRNFGGFPWIPLESAYGRRHRF